MFRIVSFTDRRVVNKWYIFSVNGFVTDPNWECVLLPDRIPGSGGYRLRVEFTGTRCIGVFNDYVERDNGTFQIPAQTNCIGISGPDGQWVVDKTLVPVLDMSPL